MGLNNIFMVSQYQNELNTADEAYMTGGCRFDSSWALTTPKMNNIDVHPTTGYSHTNNLENLCNMQLVHLRVNYSYKRRVKCVYVFILNLMCMAF